MSIYKNKTDRMDYDAIITVENMSENREIGRLPFYLSRYETDFAEFVRMLASTVKSLQSVYSCFPDDEIRIELHIQTTIYEFDKE